jgi:hypothetical protein
VLRSHDAMTATAAQGFSREGAAKGGVSAPLCRILASQYVFVKTL